MEKNSSGKAFELMNTGYRRLSLIAYHVSTKEDAYDLISQAYGSMQIFFHLLEGQRLELQSYAEKCLRQRRYFEGMILSIAARKAIRWGSRFRDEYGDLNSDRA